MSVTEFTDLRHVAVTGSLAKATRGERLIKGTINGDRLTLIFREVTLGKRTQVRNRMVFCERRRTPDGNDFRWLGVKQTAF